MIVSEKFIIWGNFRWTLELIFYENQTHVKASSTLKIAKSVQFTQKGSHVEIFFIMIFFVSCHRRGKWNRQRKKYVSLFYSAAGRFDINYFLSRIYYARTWCYYLLKGNIVSEKKRKMNIYLLTIFLRLKARIVHEKYNFLYHLWIPYLVIYCYVTSRKTHETKLNLLISRK